MSTHGPAARPCPSCPYRRDVPGGVWAPEEYDKLPPYDGDTAHQPPGAFFCHLRSGRLCAGWCGCHDMNESMGLRLAFLQGILTEADVDAALDYVCPVPLWGSGAEAAAHGRAEVEAPGPRARKTIDKVSRRQQRIAQRRPTR